MQNANFKKTLNRQTRRSVTDLAKGLFMRHGFLKVTLNDIARAAGISKRTIYQYFENKDQLVNTCIGEEINQTYVDTAIILSSDIAPVQKWGHCIELITRRSQEAETAFYRDILSRERQIQYFNKKKGQIIDLILNSFVYDKDYEQLAAILNSFLALLLISVSGQPEGIGRTAFRQAIVPFYRQAYYHLGKTGVMDKNLPLLNL